MVVSEERDIGSYLHQAGEEDGVNGCICINAAEFALGSRESAGEGDG